MEFSAELEVDELSSIEVPKLSSKSEMSYLAAILSSVDVRFS